MPHRLEHIDALRGLAILLVVFMHVPLYGFGHPVGGWYMTLAKMLAVPLFFFISGLFVSSDVLPPPLHLGRKLLKRARTLLLPTVVAGGAYAWLYGIPVAKILEDQYKAGYWFTLTLFEYYVMTDFVRLISFRRQKVFDFLTVCACMLCYVAATPSVQRWYGDTAVAHVLGVAQWKYFLFFVMGMMVRRFPAFVQSDKGGAAIVAAFLAVYGLNATGDIHWGGLLFNLNLLLQETTIVLLAYYIFHKHQNFFSSRTRTGKWLTLIGTSTLEIYLLHYFLLPRHLDLLLDYDALAANPLVALFAIAAVAVGVVAMALAVKAVLQCNGLVSKLLWNK